MVVPWRSQVGVAVTLLVTLRARDRLQAGPETRFGRRSESGERGAQSLQAHSLVVPPVPGTAHVLINSSSDERCVWGEVCAVGAVGMGPEERAVGMW